MGCGGEPTATGIFHYFSDTAKGNLAGPDVSRIRRWYSMAICNLPCSVVCESVTIVNAGQLNPYGLLLREHTMIATSGSDWYRSQ